jgi:hypothetical protein
LRLYRRGEAIYNPFDLLPLFREREFHSFWFETGTPNFPIDMPQGLSAFAPEAGKLVRIDFRLRSGSRQTVKEVTHDLNS